MLIGAIGDVHFTNKQPERRIDDWWSTQKRKFSDALDILLSRKCDCILQTGDLVDSPGISNVVISETIDIMKRKGTILNLVVGNHCLWGHSLNTLPSSPLSIFKSAGIINILGKDPYKIGEISVYGAGFGESVPTPTGKYNVLIVHDMIGNRPLFPNQELKSPRRFLNNHPEYNLIVSGHYHYTFSDQFENRTIFNPGSLMRRSISQFDLEHEPAVVIFETTTGETEIVKLDIKPVEKVFDMTPVQKRDDSKLAKFIEDLRKQRGKSDNIGWQHRLIQTMNEKGCSAEARKIIDQAMEEIHE